MLGVGRFGPLGPRASHAADPGSSPSGAAEAGAGSGGSAGVPRRAGEEERAAAIALAAADGVGPVTFDRLVGIVGSASGVLDLARGPGGSDRLADAWSSGGQRPMDLGRSARSAIAVAAARIDATLAALDAAGLRAVLRDDADFPDRLRWIETPPPVIFVDGSLEVLRAEQALAVVGTRRPSPAGRRVASRIATALARAGAIVVSGLAVGIDGAAHEATISAAGRTVAVIGSGHDRLYPTVHRRLAAAIVASGGALVSEYAPGTEPTRGTFPRRNRLISGLSRAVVVVEAGARSGALLTAAWALEQGRECFVVPGAIDAPQSAGCLSFLREWPGLARVVAGVPQLLEDLGLPGAAAFTSSRVGLESAAAGPEVGPEALVARALLAGAGTVDELVAVSQLPVGGVLGALTRLEAAGLVVGSFGRFRPAGALAAAGADAA